MMLIIMRYLSDITPNIECETDGIDIVNKWVKSTRNTEKTWSPILRREARSHDIRYIQECQYLIREVTMTYIFRDY